MYNLLHLHFYLDSEVVKLDVLEPTTANGVLGVVKVIIEDKLKVTIPMSPINLGGECL